MRTARQAGFSKPRLAVPGRGAVTNGTQAMLCETGESFSCDKPARVPNENPLPATIQYIVDIERLQILRAYVICIPRIDDVVYCDHIIPYYTPDDRHLLHYLVKTIVAMTPCLISS